MKKISDKEKIYINIRNKIHYAVQDFWNQYGYEPNRVVMSKDVFDVLLVYTQELITNYTKDKANRIMGMDIEIVYDKKDFIEVGLMRHIPYDVNTEYSTEERWQE